MVRRRRRATVEIDSEGKLVSRDEDDENLTISVFSGLYVDEEGELAEDRFLDTTSEELEEVSKSIYTDDGKGSWSYD